MEDYLGELWKKTQMRATANFFTWIGLEDLETSDLDGMYKKLCSNTRCIGLPVLRIKIMAMEVLSSGPSHSYHALHSNLISMP